MIVPVFNYEGIETLHPALPMITAKQIDIHLLYDPTLEPKIFPFPVLTSNMLEDQKKSRPNMDMIHKKDDHENQIVQLQIQAS